MPYARKVAKRARLAVTPKRERSGRRQRTVNSEREREADIVRVAFHQPHRRGSADPNDKMLGSALGRLRRSTLISPEQFGAGERYAIVASRYATQILSISRHIGGHDLDNSGGASCAAEPDENSIAKLRDDWRDVEYAIREAREPREIMEALTVVCVLDEDPNGERALAHLREGLNLLHRLWG